MYKILICSFCVIFLKMVPRCTLQIPMNLNTIKLELFFIYPTYAILHDKCNIVFPFLLSNPKCQVEGIRLIVEN